MKLLIGIFALILVTNLVASLPARSPQDDAEVISGPRRVYTGNRDYYGASATDSDEDGDDFKGIITTKVGYPFLQPRPPAFSFNWGYFDALDDILRRLRSRFYGLGQSDESDDTNESGSPSVFGLADKPKVNATSTVKVVDGHKIEINDTYYGDENSLFKVRLIKIRPLEDDEKPVEGTITSDENVPVTTTAPIRDEEDDLDTREPLAKNPNDNEINGDIDQPESISKSLKATLSLKSAPEKVSESHLKNNSPQEILKVHELKVKRHQSEKRGEKSPELEAGITEENRKQDNSEVVSEDNRMENCAETFYEVEVDDVNAHAAADNANHRDLSTIGNNEEMDKMKESASQKVVGDDKEENEKSNNGASGIGCLQAAEVYDFSQSFNQNDEELEDLKKGIVFNTEEQVRKNLNKLEEVLKIKSEKDREQDSDTEEYNKDKEVYSIVDTKDRESLDSSSDCAEELAGEILMSRIFNAEWANLGKTEPEGQDINNDLKNDIDVYDVVPVDLSNDINVNDWAAMQVQNGKYPLNPDAEFVEIIGPTNSNDNSQQMDLPKFEKLSI